MYRDSEDRHAEFSAKYIEFYTGTKLCGCVEITNDSAFEEYWNDFVVPDMLQVLGDVLI